METCKNQIHHDAEFSKFDNASGLLSPNRRDFVRYDKAASGFDNRKRDHF